MKDAKATILIVDDDPTVIATLSEILKQTYRVRVAKTGEKALELAAIHPQPLVILLDLMLPGMNGFEVLEALKANSRTNSIPVIFVTAQNDTHIEEKGLTLGAADYITKPVTPAVLLARVNTQITLSNAKELLLDENRFLEFEVARRMRQNELIQTVSIRALAHLAETRDPETGNHILRTQSYVNIIAKGLSKLPKYKDILNEDFVDLLTKSAPLHDIGKVGIPDTILLKPGKLDEDEWKIMKTHAELGAHSLELAEKDVEETVGFLKLAKEIAHWHHERWDGTGYPDGLLGENIPLSARIMAVADVFDALVTERVYKPRISIEKARWSILNDSEGHFDPDVLMVFDESFSKIREVALNLGITDS